MQLNPQSIKPMQSPQQTTTESPMPPGTGSPGIEPGAPAPGMDHLLEFRAPDLDPADGGADAMVAVGEDGAPLDAVPEIMGKDAFWIVFSTGFNLPGYLLPVFKPLGIQEGEEPPARAASDAVHELLSIYYPKALMPMGDTVALLIAAAPFFIAKAMVFRTIMQEIRRPPQKEQASSAGDQKPAQGNDQVGTPVPQEAANQNYVPPRGARSPMGWMDAEAG